MKRSGDRINDPATRPPVGTFRGRLGTLTFEDAEEFEKAARSHVQSPGSRGRSFRPGAEVTFDYAGVTHRGQVWALAPERGSFWVVSDGGRTFKVGPGYRGEGRRVVRVDGHGRAVA